MKDERFDDLRKEYGFPDKNEVFRLQKVVQ